MVGHRLGFDDLWSKLSRSNKVKDRISEGENTELNFFSRIVFPLTEASLSQNRAEVMSILREAKSPLLETNLLEVNKEDPFVVARAAEHAFKDVASNDKANFREILEVLAEYNLFRVSSKLQAFVKTADENETIFFQIRSYKDYIDENSIFRTHQGVKGNEFECVMVVLDDDELLNTFFILNHL